MTPEQNKEILSSKNFNEFCFENCEGCLLEGTQFTQQCADAYYTVKMEHEKAKVDKLKKCVEHYASLEHNSEAQSLEYDDPSFFFDGDDISTEVWTGKDHNGVERSHRGRYYGKLARQTLLELENEY